jgi:copper(I)-binding protein
VIAQRAADAPADRERPASSGQRGGFLPELVRAALLPVICAAALIGLLSAWVATGGAGTISPVRIEIGQAAITLPAGSAADQAATYLVIRNLSGPDVLLSVRTPVSGHVIFVRHAGSAAGPGIVLRRLAIPGHSTLSLSPFGVDIVLVDPGPLDIGAGVPLVLTFRHAGKVTVEATVTPPGTP